MNTEFFSESKTSEKDRSYIRRKQQEMNCITENKEKIIKKVKEYHNKNKSKLSEKVICECGSEVMKTGLKIHKKTTKHEEQMKLKF